MASRFDSTIHSAFDELVQFANTEAYHHLEAADSQITEAQKEAGHPVEEAIAAALESVVAQYRR